MASPPASTSDPTPNTPPKKRKRKDKTHVLFQSTFKRPQWIYLSLELVTASTSNPPAPPPSSKPPLPSPYTPLAPAQPESLDPLTISTLLSQPLSSYLGLTGTAIPIDILHAEGARVWIRVPRGDARGLRAGLSGWNGWCDGDLLPGGGDGGGGEEGRRKRVAWRVRGEGEVLGMLVDEGDGGRGVFGG
ncbi:hypothetical protein EJ04DRAFT_521644 [Polyplosphaeria fusca]|uniref:Ribonucleases P/MRP subunit Pop8-like domain-containing protein n=1 Tax=Polyplosphaeria fusca TaxID=682080 RepID=A0A9P4R4U7_9PLEO|nr:hypothetical protein EJ04DRAFT_521644 [Polyplosphaeria fusca]